MLMDICVSEKRFFFENFGNHCTFAFFQLIKIFVFIKRESKFSKILSDNLEVFPIRAEMHFNKIVDFSTVAALSCVVTVPLLYNYIQRVQSALMNEAEFCRRRADNMWGEFVHTEEVGC